MLCLRSRSLRLNVRVLVCSLYRIGLYMHVVSVLVVTVVMALCIRLPPARWVSLGPLYRSLRARRSAARWRGIYLMIDPALLFFGTRLLMRGRSRIGKSLLRSFFLVDFVGVLGLVVLRRLL